MPFQLWELGNVLKVHVTPSAEVATWFPLGRIAQYILPFQAQATHSRSRFVADGSVPAVHVVPSNDVTERPDVPASTPTKRNITACTDVLALRIRVATHAKDFEEESVAAEDKSPSDVRPLMNSRRLSLSSIASHPS